MITVYDPLTGKILKSIGASTQEDLELNLDENDQWIEGVYNSESYYIKNGSAIQFPPKPNYLCYFDFNSEQWVKDDEALWDDLRKARNQRLERCDWTQVPDAPVDQAAWAAYRQALRDLPANTTDPLNPPWPTKPT